MISGACFYPWASLRAQLVKHPPAIQEILVWFLGLEGIGYPLQYSWASLEYWKHRFPCSVGDLGSILGSGRSPGERKGYPLHNSGLENSMDCIVQGVTPGSSVHGISQARILEWVAISFSRGSSRPRDWTWVSCTGRWRPTWEAPTELVAVLFLLKYLWYKSQNTYPPTQRA